MKVYQLYLISILGGLLLAFGWFPYGWAPLLFIGFVPLLLIEKFLSSHEYKRKYLVLLGCTYLSFLIWNVITTWWVVNASVGGGAMAILANTLLMTMVFMTYHTVKNRVGKNRSSFIFICFWMAFEFFHLRWDLSWPWLTLGNGFADHPHWIQWYEYTGVFGGSLWVLSINLLIASMIEVKIKKAEHEGEIEITREVDIETRLFRYIIPILTLPIFISYLIYYFENNKYDKGETDVVVVQPNIDPYNEKFTDSYEVQLQKMLKLASLKVDSTTDYVVFPETAVQDNLWEGKLELSESVHILRDYLKKYPHLKIIIGANSSKSYKKDETPTLTARMGMDTCYYDDYNTALQLQNNDSIQVYHKSKLVPGVEKMPFPFLFKYLEDYAISLGGTTGSYGTQEERTAFVSSDKKSKTGAVICYESIYGEFVTGYIQNGAQFISIITNDGWWGDTPGYKQHLKFGALRAIETRRWIARSANTGISCFINPLGEIQQATDWWVPAVIRQKIQLNDKLTFYTRYGDFIARATCLFSILFLIYSWLLRFRIVKK